MSSQRGRSPPPWTRVAGLFPKQHFRGTALGFRNLTNYIARSPLEAGGFRPLLHPHLG